MWLPPRKRAGYIREPCPPSCLEHQAVYIQSLRLFYPRGTYTHFPELLHPCSMQPGPPRCHRCPPALWKGCLQNDCANTRPSSLPSLHLGLGEQFQITHTWVSCLGQGGRLQCCSGDAAVQKTTPNLSFYFMTLWMGQALLCRSGWGSPAGAAVSWRLDVQDVSLMWL